MSNPLLELSSREFNLIDFSELEDQHYLPAFEAATAAHNAEIAAILAEPSVSFENTLVAMERAGQLLSQLANVFFNKTSSDTNEYLQQVEQELSPRLTAHLDAISLNPKLFSRLLELEQTRDAGELELDSESDWLLTKYLQDFRHAGAELDESARARVAEINEELASLSAEFDKRLLADSNDLAIHLDDAKRLDGLTESELQSLRQAASDRGREGYTIPLLNYSGHPLLSQLTDRKLRQEILERTLSRGARDNANNTSELVRKMLKLRSEKAGLFGYRDYPSYATSTQTAKSPERIHAVLRQIAPVAKKNAEAEAAQLDQLLQLEQPGATLAAWDWDRYTEQLRARDYDVDTAVLKPYFELSRVLEDGVFFAANQLYGLSFSKRDDIVGYHPDNWIYQVDFESGENCGLYIFDPYARPSKSGGAWMNNLVDQSRLLNKKPVVVNNMNIPKPANGEPALMTFDEVNTLFHEFGHTLHGLLSDVTYPRFSGTSVERDFVEFPSQVNEMWMLWPEVL
ncbi:MAG: M3 family metallopeptidase, partial [Aquiluna sp.]